MKESSNVATCCGDCCRSHAVPGIVAIWCEKKKVFTTMDAPVCGLEMKKLDQVAVKISSTGYTIQVLVGGQQESESWRLAGNKVRRISGDLEHTDPELDEDLVDALLTLSVEVDRVMKVLAEIDKRRIIAASKVA